MPYSAFISYSHTADHTLAEALQSGLHRFAKPWFKLRALHIFRDQTNLAVNPALWSSIRDALDQSQFFILLASPEAAASPWVEREAEYWVGRNGSSHILIVLAGGALQWDKSTVAFAPETTNALPPSLLRSFSEEPLYLDLRWAREGASRLRLREPRFHEAVLQLASTLHNRPKDELDGADIRLQRHARWVAASVLIAALLIGIFALRQTLWGRRVSVQNIAASLAASSTTVLAESPGRAREAALLAIESNRLSPSFEGTQALRAAVSILPAATQFYPPKDSDPDERIRDLALSPDGASLAVARDNGSTQLIDLVNRKPVGFFTPDERPAARIDLSGNPQDTTPDNDPAISVAFNATGAMLASAARNGIASVWSVPEGRELLRVVDDAPFSQIAFAPAANQVVIAGDDGHVRVFDVARAATVADFKCADKVVSIAITPDGNLLAALSSDGFVSVFDTVHQKLLRRLAGGETAFNLAVSHNGRRLAAACGDFAFVWDISTGRQLLKATHATSSETLAPGEWIVEAAISPDGKFLAYAARGDKSAHVWNIDNGRPVLELKHDSAVAAVAFNADGSKLGTGSYDGTARVWELPSGNELERVPHGGGAEVVTFNSTGSRFAGGGMDGSVSVSETQRADRPAYLTVPSNVASVAFSPDGRRIAAGTLSVHWSPLVRIADIGGTTLRDIEFHGAPVIDKLFFSSDNDVIAQWSNKLFLIDLNRSSATSLPDIPGEKRIDSSGKLFAIQQAGINKLYSLPGLQQIASVTGPPSSLLRVAAEGKLLAFEENKPPNDFHIDIWSVAGKAAYSHIQLPGELNRLAFNSGGTVLFTAESQELQAWELPSGKRRFSLTASDDIDVIVPDPASTAVAILTHGHLTIWDAVTGARLAQLPDSGYIRTAAFSPDGRYLLAGYDEHAAALWLWRWGDLRDQACARLSSNFSHAEWQHWFPNQPYHEICPNLPAAK
jgi:WD40 repeat protein